MAFKEVNPEMWIPEKEGESIEGIYLQSQQEVGVNKSMLYTIKTSEGVVKNVWGSAILDARMGVIETGSVVRITYKGLGEKKGGHNPPKIFKVEVDIPEDQGDYPKETVAQPADGQESQN